MIGQLERIFQLKNLQAKTGDNGSPKIVAFTSGKGGTGKTFLSLNMAYSLAAEGNKILFLDLDANLSNANILMNVVAEKTINDYYSGQNLFEDVITWVDENFHIVFGDSGRAVPGSNLFKASNLISKLHDLSDSYDLIILDTGSGANDEVINLISRVDCNIIITTPEPTSVMDAYVMVKLLSNNGFKGKKYTIVNKCFDESDGEVTCNNLNSAVKHFLNDQVEYLGRTDFDQAVMKSIMRQELLVKTEPEIRVSGQIRTLAEKLFDIVQVANIHHFDSPSL